MGKEEKSAVRFHPLVSMKNRLDEEFYSFLKELLFLIREHGISKLNPWKDKDKFLEFAGYVHEGWKKAHFLIAASLCDLLREIDQLEKDKKSFHRAGNKDEKRRCIEDIYNCRLKVLLLRRFYDAIAWSILKGEPSTIRRLPIRGGTDNLSVKNIEDAQVFLDQYNKDPLGMAISSDITTFIHVSDVVAFHFRDGTSFIELKSGSVSKKVLDILAAGPSEAELNSLDKNMKSQVIRTARQMQRMENVRDALNKGEGVDNATEGVVKITTVDIGSPFYSSRLVGLWEKIKSGKTYAIESIDGCLHIGAYSDHRTAYAFGAWMAAIECRSVPVSLLSFLTEPTGRPLPYFDLPTEMLMDLIEEKITIVICFDIRGFVDLAEQLYPGFLSLEKKDKRAGKSANDFIALGDDEYVVAVSEGNYKGHLGTGIMLRVVYDFQSPMGILHQHKVVTDQASRGESGPGQKGSI